MKSIENIIINENMIVSYLKKELELLQKGVKYGEVLKIYSTFNKTLKPIYEPEIDVINTTTDCDETEEENFIEKEVSHKRDESKIVNEERRNKRRVNKQREFTKPYHSMIHSDPTLDALDDIPLKNYQKTIKRYLKE
ncbi:hypothetical protein KM1_128000 [Entamoeba histolytica HM-3:IMSS]|uniref:Uncharacterized protein n=4 Tax=Entamoeba histolytica TaxID=5759 RepID=C4M3T7_ENTH1|nr:hypothetical protein EHI_163560 [Entamoeba histolytica HM-1:IMSS]EAL48327.2 hypothetical protein EHI_163560 [Entamoeba histolytica HM-1:IMSS]EMS14351.1 hypothetical protein KM1_128000 [Entamoeba histolytica HM-3:IMSS]ENY61740.1 hypothetical protein EHI7A_063020 [Entamoeba histolytica HM-1:IMSS-A]GAT96000.1 hypothetical protein CL6EHI_163560 [Entamoeba histolytica]|eukprot:XP_653715.2 hypothetical protein EHI_163560 [Entamoeba histolytica HM-1:IMSS]